MSGSSPMRPRGSTALQVKNQRKTREQVISRLDTYSIITRPVSRPTSGRPIKRVRRIRPFLPPAPTMTSARMASPERRRAERPSSATETTSAPMRILAPRARAFAMRSRRRSWRFRRPDQRRIMLNHVGRTSTHMVSPHTSRTIASFFS